jgi:NUMOD3 motif
MTERGQNRVYRAIFRAHNQPPYTCSFCKEQMDELEHVHHLDEDPSNNAPSNLAAAHAFCHNSHHHTGMRHTEEIKQQISATVSANAAAMTAEERRVKFGQPGESNGFYGRQHTDEARELMRQAAIGRPGTAVQWTDEQKARISASVKAIPRQWCDECGRDWPPSLWIRHIRKYHEGGAW